VNAWTRQHVSAAPESGLGNLNTGRPVSEAAAADGARAPLCGKPVCCSLFGPRFTAAVQMWLMLTLPSRKGILWTTWALPDCDLPAAFRCLRQLHVRLVS